MKSSAVVAFLSLCLAQTAFAACRTRTNACSPQSVCDAIGKPGAFPCASTETQSPAQCSQAASPGGPTSVSCECCDL
ncbi:hypothetical protein GCG54_00012240 [Colletotrichum gloeosporioides]|uniref:Uncharacterized protein n=1 Tax=Colletotrichum gloeosporioides TaxID=474922 RepID=A0A8H4CJD5_COLGL|nr:uncharacterized protein GCG54_00012240 [Colletotrichum gloeosporioides]KAF3804747.1 hypothetical protein GCG54_00012240 [Colletotrichum gloeosporioides]